MGTLFDIFSQQNADKGESNNNEKAIREEKKKFESIIDAKDVIEKEDLMDRCENKNDEKMIIMMTKKEKIYKEIKDENTGEKSNDKKTNKRKKKPWKKRKNKR